jgi:Right handed beta helix region
MKPLRSFLNLLSILCADLHSDSSAETCKKLSWRASWLPWRSLALSGILISGSISPSFATTWYVNAKYGNDSYNGLKTTQAFQTINQACTVLQPGDTVSLAPGVYFESVYLFTLGTPSQPITFQGQTRAKNAVVITGADPNFRKGLVPWTLVNSTLNLYSAPCTWLPARVCYNQADLYPYSSLNNLQTFTTDGTTPGPLEGFYYDPNAQLLYVRLNSKYGPVNPAQNTMKVGPVNGGGPNGLLLTQPSATNFRIRSSGSGNIVFDGITFETPGIAGIGTMANDITVQNCYFIGCRSAVYGLGDPSNPATAINNVAIRYCEYTLFPTFNDFMDQVSRAYQNPALYNSLPDLWWSQRRTLAYSYEVGLVLGVGSNWKIQNNYLHDVVDAISGWGVSYSNNLEISGNVIARTIDNAVETEDHSTNMTIHDNVILDSFEPISYQPMGGLPWPSSIYVAHNVIADTAQNAAPWKYIPDERAAFKFVIDPSNWTLPGMSGVSQTSLVIPGTGFVANNNTVLMYNGNIFVFGNLNSLKLSNVNLFNNYCVSQYAFAQDSRNSLTFDFSGFNCQGNIVAPATNNISGPGPRVAGISGTLLQFNSQAQLTSPSTYNFSPGAASPLLAAGVSQSPAYNPSLDVGAYSVTGPQTLPISGIQPDPGAIPSTSIPTP